MAVSQSLTLTETSYSTSGNTSQVRIVWKSTQTGDSWNGYGVQGDYYVSINGSVETKYHVDSVELPKNDTVTILDTIITVPHREDGTGSISVRTKMDTNISAGVVQKSASLTLTTIARPSSIDSVSDQYLGSACSVKWTPKSTSFRYKVKFSIGTWSHTTEAIHPNQPIQYTYTGYTVPLDAAEQIPNSQAGTMTVTLYTYSDSSATVQVGSASSKTFTVTVPDNANTKPTASISLSPEHSLGSTFNGLYIQGYSKVKATFTGGEAKYGASITSYSINVNGTDIGDPYVSGYLINSGEVSVECKVTDSRGISNTYTKKITVISYSAPRVVAKSGETSVICARCDERGVLSDSGTSLKIRAKRSYSKCETGEGQKNFCSLRYKYKDVASDKYSDWIEFLAASDLTTDEIIIGPVLEGELSVEKSYIVQISAIDSIQVDSKQEPSPITFTIPTAKIYMHKAGSIRSLGIGTYVNEPNTLLIADDIAVKASAFNGVSMGTKWVSGVNYFDIQSSYTDFTGSGDKRQTFFIFGDANGQIVNGIARVANNGVTLWQGTEGVTLSSKAGGILTVTLPTVAYDMFTVISSRKFTL